MRPFLRARGNADAPGENAQGFRRNEKFISDEFSCCTPHTSTGGNKLRCELTSTSWLLSKLPLADCRQILKRSAPFWALSCWIITPSTMLPSTLSRKIFPSTHTGEFIRE